MRRYGLWCGLCCALMLLVGLLAVPAASALQNYTLVDQIGGSYLGLSSCVTDVAADPDGGIWVADKWGSACNGDQPAVFKINGDGSLGPVISFTEGDPECVAVSPSGEVYVYDAGYSGHVSIFENEGTSAGGITDWDRLYSVTGIALDASGDAYFANDYWSGGTRRQYDDYAQWERVWEWDDETWTGFGDDSDPSAPGWVEPPQGVAVDSSGNVYVCSPENGNGTLKKFDAAGDYLATIPVDGVGGDPDASWYPVRVTVDAHDNVYVLDEYGEQTTIYKYDPSGNQLAAIDLSGNYGPGGIAVGTDNRVYVGDAPNDVIDVYAVSAEEDTTAPTCAFAFDGTSGDNGWYTSTGDAVITATDNEGGSGVASIHCAVDGIERPPEDIVPPLVSPYAVGFTISTEGKHTVTYWAVDESGNESEHQPAEVWIDTIAPAGTFAVNGGATTTHSTSITGNSAVTDANGVEMNFSVDGGVNWTGWLTYAASEPLTLPAGDGTKMVNAEYRDPAGNELDLSDSIVLDTTMPTDTTPPTVTIDSPLAGAVYPTYPTVQPLTLDFSVDDEAGGSGTDLSLWHASVTWPDGHTTAVPLTPSPTSSDAAVGALPTSVAGDYTVTVTARDAAGNLTTATVTYSVAGGWSGLLGLPPDTNGDGYSEVDSYSTSHPLTLRFHLVTGQGGGLTKVQRCLLLKKLRKAQPRLYVWDVATHTLRFRAPTPFHRLCGNWYVYRWDTRKVKWDASWPLAKYRRMMLVIKLYDAKSSWSGTLKLPTPQVTRSVARAGKNKPTVTATLINYRKMMTRES